MAEHAVRVVTEGGFTAVKLKGTRDWEGDVAILRAVRAALPEVNLRVDPNAAWSVPDSVRAGIALEELDLEYLEDPCTGIEGMSQVKAKVRIPLCTNMCVVRFEEFAPAVRLNAVDVIHGDVYKWGGIAATKALAAHCETFGLGMNLHSGGELGIATAAHLAVVASTPVLSRAIDSMYYLHADDIIEPLHLENGRIARALGTGARRARRRGQAPPLRRSQRARGGPDRMSEQHGIQAVRTGGAPRPAGAYSQGWWRAASCSPPVSDPRTPAPARFRKASRTRPGRCCATSARSSPNTGSPSGTPSRSRRTSSTSSGTSPPTTPPTRSSSRNPAPCGPPSAPT